MTYVHEDALQVGKGESALLLLLHEARAEEEDEEGEDAQSRAVW